MIHLKYKTNKLSVLSICMLQLKQIHLNAISVTVCAIFPADNFKRVRMQGYQNLQWTF